MSVPGGRVYNAGGWQLHCRDICVCVFIRKPCREVGCSYSALKPSILYNSYRPPAMRAELGNFGEKTSEDREQCPVHIKTTHPLLLKKSTHETAKPIGR